MERSQDVAKRTSSGFIQSPRMTPQAEKPFCLILRPNAGQKVTRQSLQAGDAALGAEKFIPFFGLPTAVRQNHLHPTKKCDFEKA